MRLDLVVFVFIVSRPVMRSRAQFANPCFLNGQPVSCNDPTNFNLLSGQSRGKICLLNGNPVSCDDPNYLQAASGQQQFGSNKCFLNGRIVSCKDPHYLNSVRGGGEYVRSLEPGQQPAVGKQCYLNGSPIPCNNQLYLNSVGAQSPVGGRQCFLNGNPVSCSDPLYLSSIGSQQPLQSDQCFLRGRPVSCNDPSYLSSIGVQQLQLQPSQPQQPVVKQCFLNGSPVSCNDPLYLSVSASQQQSGGNKCFLNGRPVSCNDPAYLGNIGSRPTNIGQQSPLIGSQCHLNGKPVSCSDSNYLAAIGVQQPPIDNQCSLNGRPVSCNDQNYLNSLGDKYGGRQCFLNGKPVSCSDPLYPSTTGGKQPPTSGGGNLMCFLNGNPISCTDPRYLSAIKAQNAQQQLQQGSQCFLDRVPISCQDPNYLNALASGQSQQTGVCYVEGKPAPCETSVSTATFPGTRPPNTDNNYYFNNSVLTTRPPVYRPLPPQPDNWYGSTVQTTRPPVYPSPATRPTTASTTPTSTTAAYPQRLPIVCGQQIENSIIPLIENGERASLGEFPWHTAIYDKTKANLLICGGSIVSPFAVISAAHCFFDDIIQTPRNAADYMAVVGKVTRDYNQTDSAITKYYEIERVVMEGFYGSSIRYLNDIAILQIKVEIQFSYRVSPVCLRFTENVVRTGVLLQVAGWGVDETGKPATILKTAKFPYLSPSDCIYSLSPDTRDFITGDKFCIHHANGTALNVGDSGGGLTVRDENDQFHYLVGIVSFRSNAADAKVSVITDVVKYGNFVRKNIREIHRYKNYDVNYIP